MALELVGGALLSALLQVAFEKLASLQVRDFFRGRKLDQKLLNNLEIKLNSIQALADDAELKQFRDPRVRNWLLKVKDAVFDAEDLLDEIQHEISKCQVEAEAEAESQTCTCKVPNFFKSSPVSSFNKEIKSRMEQVLEDLENLASQSGYLGLKNASGVGSGFGGAVSQQSQSTSLLVESVIYGRDDDKEMIFNWLTSDIDNCNKLSILSIVGMGGLGKTTLAQHVYNDPRIENKFDIKAWLKELPSNLHKLTDLHRLELIDTGVRKVPAHLGKLKYLQVLMSSFKVGKSRELSIQQLGELNLHGSLSIRKLQNVENPSDALALDLKNKTHLVEVELKWDSDWNPDDSTKERDEIVIENLQPSKHLEKLTMRHYGGKQFPRWLFNNSLLNVVSLTFENCESCQRLPPLGLLPCLNYLSIVGLNGILRIDAEFHGNSSCSFASLETLEFSRMKEWVKWECQDVTGAFPRLKDLRISNCPKLKGDLPEQLVCLQTLTISNCKQLMASAPMAPEIRVLDLNDCGKLQLDDHRTTLKMLSVGGQSMDTSLMESIWHIISVSSLEELRVDYCPNMNIPMSSFQGFLVSLHILGGCNSLTTIPLDLFPILRELYTWWCPNLQRISQGQAHNHLHYLSMRECPQLESLPEGMHVLLPSLHYLGIEDCPKVEMFPEGGLPSNLKEMSLGSSKLMSLLKSALGGNHSLESLYIGEVDVECLPDEGVLPHSLVSLGINKCGDLKRLDYKGLCHLSSLKELRLEDCPRLQCLPEEGLPKSISYLRIWGECPLLKQRCRKPEGEDWPKIAHIEHFYI
ncbi:Putative disease resistance RPP13-like protein 1 [Glycine soja]|nr:Putative disease resistance RPP13-like protein 1 [Glycine soja]